MCVGNGKGVVQSTVLERTGCSVLRADTVFSRLLRICYISTVMAVSPNYMHMSVTLRSSEGKPMTGNGTFHELFSQRSILLEQCKIPNVKRIIKEWLLSYTK